MSDREIMKMCEKLNRNDQSKLLAYMNRNNVKISTCADGSRINLSTMNKDLKNDMYKLIEGMILVDSLSFKLNFFNI